MKNNTKYKRLLTICLMIIVNLKVVYGQDDWVRFKADAVISFQVDVPSEMGVKNKAISTDLGEVKTTTYAYEGKEEDLNFLYVINLVEYPLGTFPEDSLDLKDEFLNETLLSMAQSVNGEIVYQSEISNGNNGQGKLFRLKYNDGFGVIKGKVFVKEDIFITLQVYTTKDKSLNEDMDLFLNSFKSFF